MSHYIEMNKTKHEIHICREGDGGCVAFRFPYTEKGLEEAQEMLLRLNQPIKQTFNASGVLRNVHELLRRYGDLRISRSNSINPIRH